MGVNNAAGKTNKQTKHGFYTKVIFLFYIEDTNNQPNPQKKQTNKKKNQCDSETRESNPKIPWNRDEDLLGRFFKKKREPATLDYKAFRIGKER